MKKLVSFLFVFCFALLSFASLPAVAQDGGGGEPAYRLFGGPALSDIGGRTFAVNAGLERILTSGLAVGTEYTRVFGEDAVSSLTGSVRWYFTRGGRTEVFALGNYAAQFTEPDAAGFGGGANFFLFPERQNLGLRFEVRDDIGFDGRQAAAIQAGLVFRF